MIGRPEGGAVGLTLLECSNGNEVGQVELLESLCSFHHQKPVKRLFILRKVLAAIIVAVLCQKYSELLL